MAIGRVSDFDGKDGGATLMVDYNKKHFLNRDVLVT